MGLPKYGEGTDTIYQAQLTNNTQTESGVGINGDANGGLQLYSVDGMDTNGQNSVIFAPTAGEKTALDSAMHLQFDVDTSLLVSSRPSPGFEAITRTDTLNDTAFTRFSCGQANEGTDEAGDSFNTINIRNSIAGGTVESCRIGAYEKSPQTTIREEYSVTDGRTTYWVDDLPIFNQALSVSGSAQIFFSGSNSGTGVAGDGQADGYKLKNAQIQTSVSTWPDQDKAVLWLGDSFLTQGGFPSYMNAPNPAGNSAAPTYPSTIESGRDFNGVPINNGFQQDTGYLPTFMKTLYRNNIWRGKRELGDVQPLSVTNANYGQGGAGIFARTSGDGFKNIEDNYDRSVSAGYTPSEVVIGGGTNDVSQLVDAGDFSTAYLSLLDKIIDDGVQTIVIWTIPALNSQDNRNNATYDNKTAELNSIISGLNGYRGAVTVIDVFTALGGHAGARDPVLNYFKNNDIHPNERGSYQLGALMGQGLSNVINGAPETLNPVGVFDSINKLVNTSIYPTVRSSFS